MPIHVIKKMEAPVSKNGLETRSQRYIAATGLTREESRSFVTESDFCENRYVRMSSDNGRTWSDWADKSTIAKINDENDEMLYGSMNRVYDERNHHWVSCVYQRIWYGGHDYGEWSYWNNVELALYDHTFLVIEDEEGREIQREMIRIEERGAEFNPLDLLNREYLDYNRVINDTDMILLQNGDIMFTILPLMTKCCEMLGIPVEEVFPSHPQMCGLIVIRGTWNTAEKKYDLQMSRPIIMNDLDSSRGICEPIVTELKSGRILVVIRGSNMQSKNWNTRIEPFTPGFKWYTFSDDGGKTFAPVRPWYFDSREVAYSPASRSNLVRSHHNGKLYWLGNITDPALTSGNLPRWPLNICEVNDTYGYLLKDTLTMIDTKQENETDKMCLSNFNILEDRETGRLEIRLSKTPQYDSDKPYEGEAWAYYIDLG